MLDSNPRPPCLIGLPFQVANQKMRTICTSTLQQLFSQNFQGLSIIGVSLLFSIFIYSLFLYFFFLYLYLFKLVPFDLQCLISFFFLIIVLSPFSVLSCTLECATISSRKFNQFSIYIYIYIYISTFLFSYFVSRTII